MLKKLENEPFSEFHWKRWKTKVFSPAVAGRDGILLVGLTIINSIIICQVILSTNRIKEEKIVQYHVEQAFFTKSTQDWKFNQCCARDGW